MKINTQNDLLSFAEYTFKSAIDLLKKKSSDYSGDSSPFKNINTIQELSNGNVSGIDGVLVRISDKVSRLYNLHYNGNQQISDEKIQDTVIDLINYLVIYSAMLDDSKSEINDTTNKNIPVPNGFLFEHINFVKDTQPPPPPLYK